MTGPATGVWLYPWDLRDIDRVGGELNDAGVDTICVAAVYHSLLAIAAVDTARRLIELPSTCAYFPPNPAIWAGRPLHPRQPPLASDIGDVFEVARRVADRAGSTFTAWLVCLHDDRLVRDRPALAVQTATGDTLPGAPCLTAPEVREYVINLVRDAARRADAVQLESAHWLAQPHARHVKVDGAAPRLSRLLLSVCFCHRCGAQAARADIDTNQVAADLVAHWERAWDGLAPDEPDAVPGLAAYLSVRAATVTELIAEAAAAVSVPIEMVQFGDPVLHGVDGSAVAATGVDVRSLVYGSADSVRTQLGRQPAGGTAHVGLSILPEHAADVDDAVTSVRAAAGYGARSVRFYHYGLAGRRRREWLPALMDTWHAVTRDRVQT